MVVRAREWHSTITNHRYSLGLYCFGKSTFQEFSSLQNSHELQKHRAELLMHNFLRQESQMKCFTHSPDKQVR